MKHLVQSPLFILLTFTLSIISCQNKEIPSINILKEDAIKWGGKEPCAIIYTEGKEAIELQAKIKLRGGMSSKYDKHSFALELNNKYAIGNLPVDDDWILNANYIDKTFMRHKISYDLFREMNPEKNIAARSSYVNVSVNNMYSGLYVVMEKVNASMIGLDKNDSSAMLFKEPPIFHTENSFSPQDSLNYYQQKFPKINKTDKTRYIKQFIDFLFHSTDSDFVENISSWVDIESVIDWHLFLLFSNNSDGIMKNFYLYKIDKKTPFRFAIWDCDHSFGRDGDNELNMMERELDCNRSILLKRLTEITETKYLSKLKKRWFELRELNVISMENFKKHTKNNHEIIREVIHKNAIVWPMNGQWYFDANDYEQEVDLMLAFVDIRIAHLDNYFNNL